MRKPTHDDYLSWRNQADSWREINPAGQYHRQVPDLINFKSHNDGLKRYILEEIARPVVQTPPEDLYLLENCMVSDVGLVYTRDGAIFGPSAKDQIQLHTQEYLHSLDPREIPSLDGVGIFIFKSGKDNYGHLMTEILPKLENLLPMDLDRATLILPHLPVKLAQEVVGLVFDLYGDKFGFHQMGHPLLRVKYLVYPGPISDHNTRKSKTLLKFADNLSQRIPKDGGGPEKIYVSRQNIDKRRLRNEGNIRAFFEEQGFTSVFPENHSFTEQIRLFRNARLIAGPHGAGLTNALFAPPQARVIMLDPGLYDFFFFDLCGLKRQSFAWAFKGELNPMTHAMLHKDYRFPPHLLRSLLP